MKTSIIIVNFNGGELLDRCISSILKTITKEFEIILVDNSSEDNSHLRCKKKFPEISLIENKKNLGFCEGNNIGIQHSKGEFLVFLNPDTEVEPNWLEELHEAFGKVGEGLFQPKILLLDSDKIIQTTGANFNLFGLSFLRGYKEKDIDQYNKLEQIGWVSGACFFISRDTLNKIGYFDPYFFAYGEDLSISWRGAHQGIKSYYVPTSVIYHYYSSQSFKKSSIKKFYLTKRNRFLSLLTHYSRSTFYKILPVLILIEILTFIVYLFKDFKKGKTLLKVHKDLIKDKKIIYKKYCELEAKKSLDDKVVINNFLNMPQNFSFKNVTNTRASSLILDFLTKMFKHVI